MIFDANANIIRLVRQMNFIEVKFEIHVKTPYKWFIRLIINIIFMTEVILWYDIYEKSDNFTIDHF